MRKIGAKAHVRPIIEGPRASLGHLAQMSSDDLILNP
jgi:hypothetical protein